MKSDKNLLPFENILTAYFIGKEQQLHDTLVDREVENVFSQSIEMALPEDKASLMIASLVEKLSIDTSESVIAEDLNIVAIDEVNIQAKTGLTPFILNAIKRDLAFIRTYLKNGIEDNGIGSNNIPVKSLGELLKFLGISVGNPWQQSK